MNNYYSLLSYLKFTLILTIPDIKSDQRSVECIQLNCSIFFLKITPPHSFLVFSQLLSLMPVEDTLNKMDISPLKLPEALHEEYSVEQTHID